MIIHANILDWAANYDDEPFHALLCDPPYHLTEIVKRFGKAGSAPAQHGTDGAFQRVSKGFMGKTWDGGDVAYRPETWAALAQHLYPGAFGMAFSGSRGWHRMAVAIEDAGLIIHPTIFCWSYGSGFPKATRIDTQVDRRAGAERRTVGTKKHQPKFAAAELGYREKDNGYNSKSRESFDVTAPATKLAAAWAGHRYGMQAMKPAIEPIIVFQKPYAGRPVGSITATGAGALNVDGGRIGDPHTYTPKGIKPGHTHRHANYVGDSWDGDNQDPVTVGGRWPANFALVHHPACERVGVRRVRGSHLDHDCSSDSPQLAGLGTKHKTGYAAPDGRETIADWSCHPDCVAQRLGEQSGELISGGKAGKQYHYPEYNDALVSVAPGNQTGVLHSDSGTAARFFHQSDWMAERLEAADAVGYFAKASRGEREAGLDPRQIALMRTEEEFNEATINDGRKKSIDNPYQRGETTRRNTHPTIKPIALTRWLATLLLPPAMYAPRRLLIPFAGVASEMIGARLAGWEAVTGIELEADHVAIAEARLAYWQQRRWELLDPAAPITAKTDATIDGQLDMFLEDI